MSYVGFFVRCPDARGSFLPPGVVEAFKVAVGWGRCAAPEETPGLPGADQHILRPRHDDPALEGRAGLAAVAGDDLIRDVAQGRIRVEVDTAYAALPTFQPGQVNPVVAPAAFVPIAGCPTISLSIFGTPIPNLCLGLEKMSGAQSRFYALNGFFLKFRINRYELDIRRPSNPSVVETILFPPSAAVPPGLGGIPVNIVIHDTPLGVYFQGARDDGSGNAVAGSLTPWVSDIRLLSGQQLVRFLLLFDGNFPSASPVAVSSVEELRFVVEAE